MSIASAKVLVAKLQSDTDFQTAMKEAKSKQDFLNLAQKYGFNVSLEEFHAAAKEFIPKGEVMDEELDKVAGGLSTFSGECIDDFRIPICVVRT
jgi:predicted ribosomally synthesized peptide with nif11-like leader